MKSCQFRLIFSMDVWVLLLYPFTCIWVRGPSHRSPLISCVCCNGVGGKNCRYPPPPSSAPCFLRTDIPSNYNSFSRPTATIVVVAFSLKFVATAPIRSNDSLVDEGLLSRTYTYTYNMHGRVSCAFIRSSSSSLFGYLSNYRPRVTEFEFTSLLFSHSLFSLGEQPSERLLFVLTAALPCLALILSNLTPSAVCDSFLLLL